MSGEKIFDETLEFLKFYKEYLNYPIYPDELTIPVAYEGGHEEDAHVNTIPESSTASEKESILQTESGKEKVFPELNEQPSADDPWDQRWKECKTFTAFAEAIGNCPKCSLLAGTRRQIVFGTGNPSADIVVVGEAPGADEDVQGKPFVGRAGKLLTDILAAISLSRDEIFICNILKCRPPDNRNPLPDEIANCEPYLFKQLEMIKPRLILAVGTFAAQTLLQTKEPLGRLRGKFHEYKGVKMMVTYHPAALLRNPNWKRPTWEDVQLFRKEYDSMVLKK